MYHGVTIFLSAFLLFQIQPMIGKFILPWFGGTPAVWSAAMLFFQVLLLVGYAYAYWLIDRFGSRRQGGLHLALIGLSLAMLLITGLVWDSPITPDASWKPQGDESPVWRILITLAASVGLTYLVLSTNSPLMQAWFNQDRPGRSPYYLYALSNVGSLLALVSYPFLVEPALALRWQAQLWTAGYVVFALFAGYGALQLLRRPPSCAGTAIGSDDARPRSSAEDGPVERPGIGLRSLWVALSACASVMLLAVTNRITQEVAPVPFLWILPLALYLFSFILCFAGERWYSRHGYALALFVASSLFCLVLARGSALDILAHVAVDCLLLFVCCMVCHGELVRLRPHPRHLTSFYLTMAAGGAIGGIAVSLVAPRVFTGFWELELGLIGCWVLLAVVFLSASPASQDRRSRLASIAFLAGSTGLLAGILFLHVRAFSGVALHASRNFYGVLRVTEREPENPETRAHQLVHGVVVHGFQYVHPEKRRLATAYYTEDSGVGQALLHHPRRGQGMRVGVAGLGIGVLGAYAQPGDTYRFYEINPDVIRLAQGTGGYFSYLTDCRAQVEVVPGDARISLEHELAAGSRQDYDLLALDVFSSDSIPVHLLTQEAFELYLQHLRPDGVLALHITNTHLDLWPVVDRLASRFQLRSALCRSQGDGERAEEASWALLARDSASLPRPVASEHAEGERLAAQLPLWTDDYSNLFQVLK